MEYDLSLPCIEYEGALNNNGYGPHIPAYIKAYGPIPPGKVVHHGCLNRVCRQPAHLVAILQSLNVSLAQTREVRLQKSVSNRASKQGTWISYEKRTDKWHVSFRFLGRRVSLGDFKSLAFATEIVANAKHHLSQFLCNNPTATIEDVKEHFSC